MLKSNSNYSKLQPMYPLLIQQFVDDYNLSKGIAVDIGVGPGWLGMEMAKITDMKIIFLDISQESLDMAKKNVEALDVDNEVDFVQADVQAIPMEDNFADFIMSRGSIWFWKEPEKGLQEIYRILKPGGVAIVGGGLGRYLPASMRARLQEALKQGLIQRNEKRPDLEAFKGIVEKAALPNYQILTDGEGGGGRWVEIRK
ncbi:ubiquinone/menaquinone biosynthesis C-methyltransferase UbiE [Anaerotignum neopropionicum]|uniref:Ubiquinone/menaquinone biosynthesis C-methyltransferase UbiE n=1 Tax=Anaerotignum neopropionicum TaxID=36847 RepID=A0A136WB66_9FIRM|nr:class I SAM-dependent methyltransferase [Anaerotignum neopropionicum]KXL51763.1 ubiquinone/menaquinone biosynthesis C-methyltransferase UbiE [Anaerotignum neopropionicum]